MPHPDDLFVAESALREGLITRTQLYETFWALEEERFERGNQRPLGVLLVARGHLKESDLRRILEMRSLTSFAATASQTEDLNFGRVLVGAGIATDRQIEECSAIQRASKVPGQPSRRLAELLVERGYVTRQQLGRVKDYEAGGVHGCPQCGTPYSSTGMIPGNVYLCKICAGHLPVPDRPAPPPVRPAPAVAPESVTIGEQAEVDRALALWLRQKQVLRRDAVREAERIQLDFLRIGFTIPLLEILRHRSALSDAQLGELGKVDFAAIVKRADWKAQVFPGYLITGKIASGGFATIFAAKRLFTQGNVALKVLHRDRAAEDLSVARFKNEAALLMRLDHPNIVKGYEYGVGPAGLPFLAMEYVQGDSVDHMLARRGAFPPDLARDVVKQIAQGLQYLQEEGYIHRDVKPENILLDDRRRARLCDLGFARVIVERAGPGAAATTVGTRGYLSPEQARGDLDLKVGTDIYSLGLTYYAMLSGAHPVAPEGSEEMISGRLAEGSAGPDLEGLVAPPTQLVALRKMLDADRTKRFRTYAELLEAL